MIDMSSHRSPSADALAHIGKLNLVVIADTNYIASAVIDSLPPTLSFFLVGPKSVAFLRRSKRCLQYFETGLSLDADKADFVQVIEKLSGDFANLFLIPVDDSANRIIHSTFARLRPKTFPIPDSASFELLNDKWLFHQLCSRLKIRVPRTVMVEDKSALNFERLRAAVGAPLVVKPTNRSNSVGVCVIHSAEQLQQQVLSNPDYAFSPLLVQEFVHGDDIDVSVFANGGRIKNLAVQVREERALCFVENTQLAAYAERLASNLGYSGLIHIDARMDKATGEVFVLEANPRFWGSLLEATCSGLNFVQSGIWASMGYDSAEPATIPQVCIPNFRWSVLEIAARKKSYSGLTLPQRLRLKHIMRSSIRKLLHLPEWA